MLISIRSEVDRVSTKRSVSLSPSLFQENPTYPSVYSTYCLLNSSYKTTHPDPTGLFTSGACPSHSLLERVLCFIKLLFACTSLPAGKFFLDQTKESSSGLSSHFVQGDPP